MKWNNLKNYKCPKCSSDLITNNSGNERLIGCEDEGNCGFVIRLSRFESLVKDIIAGKSKKGYKPQFGDDTKNFEMLNNLGHKKVAEDFSDSSFLNY